MTDKKIIGIIPSRYASSRFPGKPLADIFGKPMVWWVYQQLKKVKYFSEIYVATDDNRIKDVCEKHGLNVVMTRNDHPEHISRIHEVSDKIKADFYVCVNGDEPLIDPVSISTIIEKTLEKEKPYFTSALRILTDPAEVVDFTNIKIVTDDTSRCIYMSRTPIPYPKGSLFFKYKKCVGIECCTKEALDFFTSQPMGKIEKIEDIDQIRFLEHNKDIYYEEIASESIAVDTPKDLEKVISIIQQNIDNNLYDETFLRNLKL